jgi:hypothetical protein
MPQAVPNIHPQVQSASGIGEIKEEIRFTPGNKIGRFPSFDRDLYLSIVGRSEHDKYELSWIVFPCEGENFAIHTRTLSGKHSEYNFDRKGDRVWSIGRKPTKHVKQILEIYGLELVGHRKEKQTGFTDFK